MNKIVDKSYRQAEWLYNTDDENTKRDICPPVIKIIDNIVINETIELNFRGFVMFFSRDQASEMKPKNFAWLKSMCWISIISNKYIFINMNIGIHILKTSYV